MRSRDPIGHMFAGAINYSDVVSQNQKLRYELGKAELKANETWAENRQLQQLSTQLDVPFVGSLADGRGPGDGALADELRRDGRHLQGP